MTTVTLPAPSTVTSMPLRASVGRDDRDESRVAAHFRNPRTCAGPVASLSLYLSEGAAEALGAILHHGASHDAPAPQELYLDAATSGSAKLGPVLFAVSRVDSGNGRARLCLRVGDTLLRLAPKSAASVAALLFSSVRNADDHETTVGLSGEVRAAAA